ncbi:MAG: phospholipase D-like domain-containing protein [Terracidiphilus sp.]|jgi:hypothetical protein
MAIVTATKNSFTVKAYLGDNKTLLAFNFASKNSAKNLAGFTIACQPKGQPAYYLFNELKFQTPSNHAQVAADPANSSINAPIHKFRWVHVPGSVHQGVQLATGPYTYTVTPRYFDNHQSMQPLDPSLSVSVTVTVGPFKKGSVSLGFTRGYMQSEAFTNHFGLKALLQPAGKQLLFDTSAQAGSNATGQTFTYADEYAWMGASARVQIFALLNQILNNPSLHLDMFAYDLNEPDILNILFKLAGQGRIRIILDNAALHHSTAKPTPEDQFTTLFTKAAKAPAAILRGHFGRYSHDKVFIVSDNGTPTQVLTGSTNFSVTGLYVNANHVLVFDDAGVAAEYSKVFNESWNDQASEAFAQTPLAAAPYVIPKSKTLPQTSITFSPHTSAYATAILDGISQRITQEGTKPNGSVLFAVMQLTGSASSVYSTLCKLHSEQNVFSYGISDSPGGVTLYSPGGKTGVLVTGKPGKTTLPPPFNQVPSITGHEIHDKFVVCGFNGDDPVVYCGSSNLASGGEAANGDNLLAVHDPDIATAFMIEALLLVDHYAFLDRYAAPAAVKTPAAKTAPAKKSAAKKATGKKSARTSASHGAAPLKASMVVRKAKPATGKAAAKKKTVTSKPVPVKKAMAAKKSSAAKTPPPIPRVDKQPRSKQQAAISAGMYLSTTDAWTAHYFDPGDLHCMERELFG